MDILIGSRVNKNCVIMELKQNVCSHKNCVPFSRRTIVHKSLHVEMNVYLSVINFMHFYVHTFSSTLILISGFLGKPGIRIQCLKDLFGRKCRADGIAPVLRVF